MTEPRRGTESSGRDARGAGGRARARARSFSWLFGLSFSLPLVGCGSTPQAAEVTTDDQRVAAIRSLHEAHRFRAALQATDDWLAAAPDAAVALDWKTKLLRELGEERRALEGVQARRAKAPQDAGLAFEAGELLAHVGNADRALIAFDEAHGLAPDDWRPAVGAAALLLAKKSPDVAGAQARLAPFLDGAHASVEARFHQALALESAGDAAGSRAMLERALELDPLHVPSLRNLALMREKDGDVEGALDLWRRVKRGTSPQEKKFVEEVDARVAELKKKSAAAAETSSGKAAAQ